MTSPVLEAYLSRLERELRQRGLRDRRIIDEAREHLVDAVEDGLHRGLSVEGAESQVLVRFGPPEIGDSMDKMRAAGYSDDIVKMGAIIRVRGFRARSGANVADTIAGPRRGALARVMDLAKAGRMMYGTEIALADGRRVPFGLATGSPRGFRPEPPNSIPERFQ